MNIPTTSSSPPLPVDLENRIDYLESWTPLLLGLHGIALLVWRGEARLWPWFIVAGILVLGLLRFAPILQGTNLKYIRAGYIFVATWLLMLGTEGVESFFMLWVFVLVSVYAVALPERYIIVLPVVVASTYFLFLFLGPPATLPLIIILARVFLICFIGVTVYLVASTMRSYLQSQESTLKLLRTERTQLRTLIDTIPDYIYFKDTESRFVINNRAHSVLMGGASQQELMGKTDFDFFPTDNAKQFHADEQTLLHSGEPLVDRDEWVSNAKGERRLHLSTKVPLRDNQGKITGFIGITRDITKQKQVEEALRISEARNRALLAAIPDAIMRIHRDGAMLDIKEPTNYAPVMPADQMIGKKQHDILPRELAQQAMYYVTQALKSGELQSFEYFIRIGEGIQTREARVMPTAQDEVVAIVRDITERREARDALQQSEAFNQSVLDSLAAHIAVLDEAGIIIAVNQSWEHFACENGSQAPEHTGMGANYLAVCENATGESSAEAQAVYDGIRAVMRGKISHFSLEYPCYSPTAERWFLLNAVPLVDHAGGAVVSHLDVTERKQAEEALSRSEARNRALLEAIPDAIFQVHRDGTVLDAKAATDFPMLRPVAEYIGKRQSDVFSPELTRLLDERNHRALETGKLQTLEYEIEVAGAKQIRESRAVPVNKDEIITIVRDITEQRQIQESLRSERGFAQSLVETAQAIILVLDPAGQIVSFNPYMEEISGYRLAEVQGKDWFSTFLPIHDHEEMRTLFLQAIDDIQTHGNINPIVTKDGCELDIEWYDKALKDAGGNMVGLLAIGQDVTQRRRAEKMLHESEARNRALLEAIPDAILRIDSKGIYVDIKAPVEFTPLTPVERMIGKHQRDILPTNIARNVMFYNDRALETGETQTFEYKIEKDGESYIRESRVVPSGDDEVTVMVRDVTERARAQAEERRLLAEVQTQREQLRALNQRLGEIQEAERRELARELHDQVGQNLSTLGLSLNIIQSQVLTELPQADQLQTLLTDSRKLIKQTTERVRNVMAELRPPMLDDYGLPATLAWYADRAAQRAGFSVDVDAEEPIPRLSEEVENALFRITQEAMTNIMKHAQATQVDLQLLTNDHAICLTIRDNGQGFDPTPQADASMRASWGLLSMRERAEAVGGHFTIDSQKGLGTTIRIEVDR